MELSELKKEIPSKWRVQTVNQWGANCAAYIDSRDVQDLLDEVVGQANWQCEYYEQKGNLFCKIGIYTGSYIEGGTESWVWKSDCGTESNVEKEKGEASDAFKRAGVMWGIGRFLYSKTIVKLPVKDKEGKFVPYSDGKYVYGAEQITSLCNKLSKNPPKPKDKVKAKLTDKGMEYLKSEKSTPKDFKQALELRDLTAEQRNEIENMLTVVENG